MNIFDYTESISDSFQMFSNVSIKSGFVYIDFDVVIQIPTTNSDQNVWLNSGLITIMSDLKDQVDLMAHA